MSSFDSGLNEDTTRLGATQAGITSGRALEFPSPGVLFLSSFCLGRLSERVHQKQPSRSPAVCPT